LPLTQRVTFKVQLQNQNRFQVPKVIRWHYKLEASQLLKVTLRIFNLGFEESFLGKMLPDGRVTVPRLVIVELIHRTPDLKAYFIEVTLEPV
jgi:hypothetical protein